MKSSHCIVVLLTLIAVMPSPVAAIWGRKIFDGIGVRNAHAMTYDGRSGKVLLFGGADESKVCADTWEWDGKSWIQVSQKGPGPRTFPAIGYDGARKRVVL